MNLKIKKQDFNKMYLECEKSVQRICYIYSNYYSIDYEDLLSESNEIFLNCTKKYFYNQVPFTSFFINQLKKHLNYFCLNQIRGNIIKNKRYNKIETEMNYIKNEIIIKDNWEELDFINDEIKDLILKIIDFCIDPDLIQKVSPFLNIKKQKKIKVSAYIIIKYFNKVFGFSKWKMEKAIKGIKYILKEELL